MALVEGLDYCVYIVPFPNTGEDGALMSSPDGCVSIYLNSRVCPDRQRKALKHELEHLANGDLYSSEPVESIEGRMND